MRLLYEFKKTNIGVQITLETEGNYIELASAVGRLMQQIYLNMNPFMAEVFRKACQAVTADDSPIWKPEEGIKIDLAALKQQRGEQ